jgi:uncharacterized protein YabE (DUF348 family)
MKRTTTVPIESVHVPDDIGASWLQGSGLLQSVGSLVILVLVVGAVVVGYQATLTPVTLVIDGQVRALETQQETVGALLMDAGLTLIPEDVVTPALDAPLESEMVVQVRRARQVTINADGHHVTLWTHATSVEAILEEARVSVGPYDEVEVKAGIDRAPGDLVAIGKQAGYSSMDALEQSALASPLSRRSDDAAPDSADFSSSVEITLHRAIPFILHEDGTSMTLYTTAPTVGEALRRAGLTLYLADGVQPGLGEAVSEGLHVQVDRSIPVTIQVDGRTLRTRTHRERVDEVLADLGVVLTGQDYTIPPLDAPLGEDAAIRVVRVTERFLIEQDPVPFETVWQPDPDLEIDYERVLQEGQRGILERRFRMRYEDGNEISRTLDREYVAVPPQAKIYGYGTKIIVRTLDTPSGPVEYWRTIRMLATSYSAGTAGTPKTSPWYGRTATGMDMKHGIVAVDPRVISLYSQVYVPNYGIGTAGDTGGAIKGRRIDLGYDDDNLVLWYRWVDVYLLTPVPPSHEINYLLG